MMMMMMIMINNKNNVMNKKYLYLYFMLMIMITTMQLILDNNKKFRNSERPVQKLKEKSQYVKMKEIVVFVVLVAFRTTTKRLKIGCEFA